MGLTECYTLEGEHLELRTIDGSYLTLNPLVSVENRIPVIFNMTDSS